MHNTKRATQSVRPAIPRAGASFCRGFLQAITAPMPEVGPLTTSAGFTCQTTLVVKVVTITQIET